MQQVIYADILFLIDISMDFLALYITAFIIKLRFKTVNCIFAAILGAVFSVFSVVLRSESIILSMIVSVAMCMVAFLGNGIKVLFKTIIIFYSVNMLLGGVMTTIFNIFNAIADKSTDLLFYGEVNTLKENLPFAIFVLGFVFIFIMTKILMNIFSKRPCKETVIMRLTVRNKSCDFVVSEDSGNRLVEPISGEPVIFLKESSLKKIVSEDFISALKMNKEFYSKAIDRKFRIVVYKTVSGNDMCVCAKPDRITIENKQCTAWITIGKNLNTEGIDGIVPSSLLV